MNPAHVAGIELISFLSGMFLIWGALGSPMAAYDHDLLTVHMIQNLLLMVLRLPLRVTTF